MSAVIPTTTTVVVETRAGEVRGTMRLSFMQRPLHPRVSETVLPTYILHGPIVLAIAFVAIQWPLALWAKVLVTVVLGVAASLAVAGAIVRVTLFRPLLGVRGERPGVMVDLRRARAAVAQEVAP
jgi:hypothetical protein